MDLMTHLTRACAARLAVAAGLLTLALHAGPAAAAPTCGDRVINDWADNGRIDRVYQLQCYEVAIDTIPDDLRDYTNATDIIQRALTAALRSGAGSNEASSSEREIDTSGPSSLPIVLLAAAGFALVVVAAGGFGYVSRRRRGAA